MKKQYRKGATGALLDEYENVLAHLQEVMDDISEAELVTVADNETQDQRCRSVQTILAHVVSAGLGYAVYIRQWKGEKLAYPEDILRNNIPQYKTDLNNLFDFTAAALHGINEHDLEEHDNTKKIMTFWGQVYDIEQIIEHAIVHVMRHRRQIEKFKMLLRAN